MLRRPQLPSRGASVSATYIALVCPFRDMMDLARKLLELQELHRRARLQRLQAVGLSI